MGRQLINIVVKNTKSVKRFKPNNRRLSFYVCPLGDVSTKTTFSKQDLLNIKLIEQNNSVNIDLFEHSTPLKKCNINSLFCEGVITNVATGSDLGIYDYPTIVDNDKHTTDTNYSKDYNQLVGTNDISISYSDSENYFFRNCVLAEENPLGGDDSKVVFTFTGYLEVIKGDFSIIHNCDYDKRDISGVYIPNEYVYKYQLRHGDEIVCTCKMDNNQMLMGSLFTINQIARRCWNTGRPWFNDLVSVKPQLVKTAGEYISAISHKFGLYNGDNVFMYLTKTTQKQQVLDKILKELNLIFDKIIYININYQPKSVEFKDCNIAKFTTVFNEEPNNKISTILLAIQYSKRLVEIGKKIVIFIDGINAINELDKPYGQDEPIIKTIFSAVKVVENGGCSSFSLASLRADNINSLELSQVCKNVETLGMVVDNNEIDLFSSYRI